MRSCSSGSPACAVPERPRDELGRPLAWDAEGFPGVDPRDAIDGDEAVALSLDYLARGLPFHAHEVLEIRWRCCPDDERPLWRGLAQAAAGATHAARGNEVGARRLVDRGRATIAEYDGPLDDTVWALIAALIPARASGHLLPESAGVSRRQVPSREE
jgi:hypothetical protein